MFKIVTICLAITTTYGCSIPTKPVYDCTKAKNLSRDLARCVKANVNAVRPVEDCMKAVMKLSCVHVDTGD